MVNLAYRKFKVYSSQRSGKVLKWGMWACSIGFLCVKVPNMLNTFLNDQLLVLLSIVLIGFAVGQTKIRGISLGSSACLFVAMGAGIAGATIPPIITDLGIVFFVYAIGLQAGPHFFRLFKRRGVKYTALGFFTVIFSCALTICLAYLLHVKTSVAVGAFAGALTSTPALASAINSLANFGEASGAASLGYAITYPAGLAAKILFVQFIPKIFSSVIRKNREDEAKESEEGGFKTGRYRLTNINLAGKTVEELSIHSICRVNLTRIHRGQEMLLCLPNTRFEPGDVVVAVGTRDELDKFKMLFGEEISEEIPMVSGTEMRDVFVSGSEIVGKPLKDLKLREVYGINLTRIYKGDVAITPTGSMVLDVGDSIRVVGTKEGIEKFVEAAGSEKRRLDETNILILAVGMLMGVLLGAIPLKIGGLTFKLGIAGGPLIAALILGHFGKIGRWSIRMPNATKFFIRDIGLVFFFVGVGVSSGGKLLATISEHSVFAIFIMGVMISVATILVSFVFINKILRVPMLSSLGAMCGAMTSSPALAALVKTVEDESPVVSYAAVYPVAVILFTVFGHLLVFAGMLILGGISCW